MSRSSSLLSGRVDTVSLNSSWSSLAAGCCISVIVNLVSDALSLYAAHGCAFVVIVVVVSSPLQSPRCGV